MQKVEKAGHSSAAGGRHGDTSQYLGHSSAAGGRPGDTSQYLISNRKTRLILNV